MENEKKNTQNSLEPQQEHSIERSRQIRQERIVAKARKRAAVKKGLLIALCVFLALVLVALIFVVAYAENLLSLMNRVDPDDATMSSEEVSAMLESMKETVPEDYTGETISGEEVDWGDTATEGVIENSEEVINVLIIGQDRRAGEKRSRSDVMILCTVNIPAKTLTLTSFMRDMYVQIPGYSSNRINATYVWGGMSLLDKTLETNFGVQVDGNVEVDFTGFIDIVDMMGGIDMELTAAEAKYMNKNHSFDVEGVSGEAWNLKSGVNHLDGAQALSYARMRYVGNADYERTSRQRKVISALIEKAKGLSISELNLLLQHGLPMITTDMDDQQILGYAMDIFPILSELTVQSKRIPVDGGYKSTYVDGMAVLVPNLEKNRDALEEIMSTD